MFGKKKQRVVESSYAHYHNMSTLGLIRQLIINKLPKEKANIYKENLAPIPAPENIKINNIAIILDGIVEETVKCQNRLAALLLSDPQFVEFDPETDTVQIGSTKYIDNKFVQTDNEMLSEDEIESLLENLQKEKKNEDQA